MPIWIDYMTIALKDKPIHPASIPENIVVARINRHSGQVTDQTDPDGIDEYFVMGSEPRHSCLSAHRSLGRPAMIPKATWRNFSENSCEINTQTKD